MVPIRSQVSIARQPGAALAPLRRSVLPVASAAAYGTAASLAGSDRLALGRAGKVAGVGMSVLAARNVARVVFPGAADKPKHAMACAAVTGTVSVLTGSRLAGIGAGLAVGILKECYDGSRFNPTGSRDFSLKGDLGADAIGIAMGALIR
jgi:hypothetical protein